MFQIPVLAAICNWPSQFRIDKNNFKEEQDHKEASQCAVLAHLMKLVACVGVVTSIERLQRSLSKGRYELSSALFAVALSLDILVFTDNFFELYCRRPVGEALFMHESQLEQLSKKKPEEVGFWDGCKAVWNSGKTIVKNLNSSAEDTAKKKVDFLFRNTITQKLYYGCVGKS